MIAIRYLSIFLMPLLAAVVLFYGTTPLRIGVLRNSAEFLDAISTLTVDELAQSLLQKSDTKLVEAFDRLRLLTIGTILATGGIAALFIREGDSDQRRLNLLATLVAGFAFAHLIIQFGFLKWLELGLWVIASLVVAVGILWVHAFRSRKGRITATHSSDS
ncbi:MAG: hypothetical protein O9289_14555 [Rhodobacteraceae bacterium]|jgi:hypothetical protein|nr:hypothetical protein [Paracoccaceae bacterium]MCZ8084416.1 hypothetical protein [Paracoccaceae bacterium]